MLDLHSILWVIPGVIFIHMAPQCFGGRRHLVYQAKRGW